MTFLRPQTETRAPALRDLYVECSHEEKRLSPEFYRRCLQGRGTSSLTPFAGIVADVAQTIVSAASRLASATLVSRRIWPPANLHDALTSSLSGCFPPKGEVHVAVSGGIDSWLLAVLVRSLGHRVQAWYLETDVPGYCEREQTTCLSRALGIPYEPIRVAADDFLSALPDFIAITETPIYNLHPVSKLLLAKALRERGVSSIVTGDGADQVMRHEWDCDLLPLTRACFHAAGIGLVTPFLSAPVLQACDQPYPDKRPVRELAQRLGIPATPKHPTFFPPVELPMEPRTQLPVPTPYGSEDRAHCLSYTTGMLLQTLEEYARCAASRE